MATLILEHDGQRRGAVLHGRTVIGRRASSHIVIPDTSVSRVHAWIGRAGHTFFISDCGSRTGTSVNGQPVQRRRSLRDGDEIRIGPVRITFFDAAALPAGIEPLLSPPESASDEEGIFVYCTCGAPIWAPWEYGGRTGRCRHCGSMFELPTKPDGAGSSDPSNDTLAGGMPSPFAATLAAGAGRGAGAAPRAVKLRQRPAPKPTPDIPPQPAPLARAAAPGDPPETEPHCGACQSPISVLEPTTTCPECGVTFHSDCWTENRGCSSYGCKQVGVLDPPGTIAALPKAACKGADIFDAPRANRLEIWAAQWEPVLLPGSALLGLAGVFAFGVPSLAVAAGLVVFSVRREPNHRRLFAAATIVSAVMAVVGSALSTYWWLHP